MVAISYPAGTDGYVTLEGEEVATARELIESTSADLKIEKLTAQLEVTKDNWKMTNPNDEFQGELIIQSDQNVDFAILKRVMYPAGVAGYGNLLFAVLEKGGSSAE